MAKKKTESKEKTFKSFDEMMDHLGGLAFDELKKLKLKDKELNEVFHQVVEDDGAYGFVFACYPHDPIVRALREEHGLNIITYSIEDQARKSLFIYSTGMHFINRERYYFCKSSEEAFCTEKF